MQLRYKLKTASIFYPVTLTELKANLHILNTDQDTLLQDLIYAAIDYAQTFTGRQFARATYTAYLDAYPAGNELEIELGPVDAITSVKYYAQGSVVITTVSSTLYQLDNTDLTARLRFLESFTPDFARMNIIEVEFTNGWAAAADIPKRIKQAIILIASEMYLHPENQQLNIGSSIRITSAQNLLGPYKVQRY